MNTPTNSTICPKRNAVVDVIRGIAMLLVILGHSMTGSALNSENSIVYNIIWTIQMPLFIVISGYVTRYSHGVDNIRNLLKYLKKRSLAYLLPFCVWTFIIRGFIFGQTKYLDIKYVIYHMDSGYWFLFSIWTISVIYGISAYLANKTLYRISRDTSEKPYAKLIMTVIFCSAGEGILCLMGIVFGFSFLCVKLSMYYLVFYIAGFIYGALHDQILSAINGKLVQNIMIAVSCITYIVLITKSNYYYAADNLIGIVGRTIASLTGIITVCGLCSGLFRSQTKTSQALLYIGRHSLEIYVIHYFFLSLIQLSSILVLSSPAGVALTAINYVITVVLASGTALILNQNNILKFILFGKSSIKSNT